MTLPAGPGSPPVPSVCLVVLDGWGLAPPGPGNAVEMANTPVFDELWAGYPHTTLAACGRAVGLPDGQMGNSEVGHLNLGAGAVVRQDLTRIDDAIAGGSFARNEVLRSAYITRAGGEGDTYAVDSRSHFEPEWFLPASNRMEIVSSAWRREPVPAGELLDHFRRKNVKYVVVDYRSHKDGTPRYFFFDSLPGRIPTGLREAWSLPGRLQILELGQPAAAPEAARSQ